MADLASPRVSTVNRLYGLSMNRCAMPGCDTAIIDAQTNTIVGEVCHIKAQNTGGPRHDDGQSPEERHGFENLVLMCSVHHKIIDAKENLAEYTVERLREIKADHERKGKESSESPPSLTKAQLNELITAAAHGEQQVTHWDFREAEFNAGGHGGINGGGGGGGVITIVGSKHVPPEAKLKLDGQFPGGGGGALNFIGRPATQVDVAAGLRISSIFTANSFHFDHGLFHVLGGGWTYLPLKKIPSNVSINVICAVELGSIAVDTIIRFDIYVFDPKESQVASSTLDVSVANDGRLISRYTGQRLVSFKATERGIWTIKVESGGIPFAGYDFEIDKK